MVNVFFEDTENLRLDPTFFEKWLTRVCENEGAVLGDLTLIFCSDEYLLEINRKHLNHDYYTDIITFDYSDTTISGDLFISIDRIRDNAKDLRVEFKTELNRVVVHGVLHLLGYTDKEPAEKKRMTQKEDDALMQIVSRET